MMRLFINLFLLLFLMDGTVSFFDDLFSLFSMGPAFTSFRNTLAAAVAVMAFPVYLCLGVDSRLPKRYILPLTAFIYLSFIAAWIFPLISSHRLFSLFLSTVQLLLATLPYSPFRSREERNMFLSEQLMCGPVFNWKNSALFFAVSLLIIPVVLITGLLATANSYADQLTAGFIRIAPAGMYMGERVYRKDNKTIRLIAMVHIGEQGYYDDLFRSELTARSIVLAEGVTDNRRILRNRLGYGKVAGLLGLTSQEHVRFEGRQIQEADMDGARSKKEYKSRLTADILRADVDVSIFQPKTIAFLDAAGKYMNDDRIPFTQGMKAFNSWAGRNISPEDNRIIMNDIIHQRNMALIRGLDRAIPRYESIAIPWGALHMPEIEQEVLKRGFVLQESRSRVSLDFHKLLRQMMGNAI